MNTTIKTIDCLVNFTTLYPAGIEVCYLLHFDRPISNGHTTQHYLGTTTHLAKRLIKHADRPDAKLLQVAKERGIGFTLVKVGIAPKGEGRKLELQLKAYHNSPKFCQCCKAKKGAV